MIKKIAVVGMIIAFALGACLYWIDSKIDKNEIITLITKNIESNMVGTKATIANIEYKLGFNLSFDILKLAITDSKTSLALLEVNEASVDMNILSILFYMVD